MKIEPAIFHRRFEYDLSVQPLSDQELELGLAWCMERSWLLHSVALNASQLALGARLLQGSGILPAAGVNFPLGGLATEMAQLEAAGALSLGALQLDAVLPAGRLRGGEFEAVGAEMAALKALLPPAARLVLVAPLVHFDAPLRAWCAGLAVSLGAALRSGSGYEPPLPMDDLLQFAREHPGLELVACGGAGTPGEALRMLQGGAARIATDQLPALLAGLEAQP